MIKTYDNFMIHSFYIYIFINWVTIYATQLFFNNLALCSNRYYYYFHFTNAIHNYFCNNRQIGIRCNFWNKHFFQQHCNFLMHVCLCNKITQEELLNVFLTTCHYILTLFTFYYLYCNMV